MPQDSRQLSDHGKPIRINDKPIGLPGVSFDGTNFTEEVLGDLQFPQGYAIFDRMRRSDYQIKRILRVIESTLLGADYRYMPVDSKDEAQKKQADFKNNILTKWAIKGWQETLREILSHLTFGFAIFEPYYHTITDREFGEIQTLRELGFRKQSTIQEWKLARDGSVIWVNQDITEGDFTADINIPGEDLLIFSSDKEGDNWEGVSLLRAAYGSFKRKDLYLKLDMIGMEKMSIGTPTFYLNDRQLKDPKEVKRIEEIGRAFTAHQNAYLILPESMKGGGFVVEKGDYKSDAINNSIQREDMAILDSVLASFLDIGTRRSGGNAQNEGLMGLFLNSLVHVSEYICQTLSPVLDQVYVNNFGEPEVLLKLECTGINKRNQKEFAEVLNLYSKNRLITPDDILEERLRADLDLPEVDESREEEKDEETKVTPEPKKPETEEPEKKEEPKTEDVKQHDVNLEHRDHTEFEKKFNIKETEQSFERGEKNYDKLVRDTARKMRDKYLVDLKTALKQANNAKAIGSIKIGFTGQLIDDLKKLMKGFVSEGSVQAKKDLKSVGVSLQEEGKIKNLPTKIDLTANKIVSDITDRFDTASTLTAIDAIDDGLPDDKIIEATEDSIDEFIAGSVIVAGSGAVVNKFINIGRNNTFVAAKDQVQVFQFSAVLDNRTTDICRSLDGKTFTFEDGTGLEFRPPLHFNCRSIILPVPGAQAPTGLKVESIVRDGKTIPVSEILKQKQFDDAKSKLYPKDSSIDYEKCEIGDVVFKDGKKYIKDYDGKFRLKEEA